MSLLCIRNSFDIVILYKFKGEKMKKYFITMALMLITTSTYALNVTGEHFDAKFKIDSITVGENQSTINASSPDAGQYGKVYVSYNLTSSPGIEGSGTWTGHGRGISPDGVLARGILRGVWTMDGKIISIKSLDSVSDGINYVQGTIDLISGDINLEVYGVD